MNKILKGKLSKILASLDCRCDSRGMVCLREDDETRVLSGRTSKSAQVKQSLSPG